MAAGVGIPGPCTIALAPLGMNPIASSPMTMASETPQPVVPAPRDLRRQRYPFGPAMALRSGI